MSVEFTASEFGELLLNKVADKGHLHYRTVNEQSDPTAMQYGSAFAVIEERETTETNKDGEGLIFIIVAKQYDVEVTEFQGIITFTATDADDGTRRCRVVIDSQSNTLDGDLTFVKQLLLFGEWSNDYRDLEAEVEEPRIYA